MSGLTHKIYVLTLMTVVIIVSVFLAIAGADYYLTDKEQRFFHEQNELLKPSGLHGHGLGIIGFSLIMIGILGYIARKRIPLFSGLGSLLYWLEFHIFMAALGSVLVLFHTTFKFAGIAAYGFWSLVVVIVSGIIGRYIYIQVPRNRDGREIDLEELKNKKENFYSELQKKFLLDKEFIEFIKGTFIIEEDTVFYGLFISIVFQRFVYEQQLVHSIKSELLARKIPKVEFRRILKFIRAEIVLSRRITWLPQTRKYYRIWHNIHLPLAVAMIVLIVVHVVIAFLFGYAWIF